MKKHIDGYWYFQKIAFDDLYKVLLRQNELQHNYPKELADKYPSNKMIEQENIKSIDNSTKDLFKSREMKHKQ